jgi:hypothetical protein
MTGDRENLETEVGTDVLRRVPRHLEAIGKQDRLALVLYTLGGDTNTPWPFVNFLRYIETPTTCDSFVTRGSISQQPRARQQQQAIMTPANLEESCRRRRGSRPIDRG